MCFHLFLEIIYLTVVTHVLTWLLLFRIIQLNTFSNVLSFRRLISFLLSSMRYDFFKIIYRAHLFFGFLITRFAHDCILRFIKWFLPDLISPPFDPGFYFHIVLLHDSLNSYGTSNNIPEPSHPHIPILFTFSTKNKQSLASLEHVAPSPSFR